MYYAKIIKGDMVNGEGCGLTIFISGCTFKCEGCYNEAVWDFEYGKLFTIETLEQLLNDLDNEYIDHVSILGGEALHPQNYREVMLLCKIIKTRYEYMPIWVWTGYKFTRTLQKGIGKYLDVVIDGKYMQDLPTTKLYRGSDNQNMWRKQKDKSWLKLN